MARAARRFGRTRLTAGCPRLPRRSRERPRVPPSYGVSFGVSPAAGSERIGGLVCGRPPAWRDGLVPVDFTKNRREYGLVGCGTVLLPDGAEHTLATGLSHQLGQDAVVNFLAACQLVVCGLRDLRHAGMSSRLIKDHE